MFRSVAHKPARALAMLALCLQIFMPGIMAVAQPGGVDVARYLCSPSGLPPTVQAERAITHIAGLLGEDTPQDLQINGHCPYCTLVVAAPLPLSSVSEALFTYTEGPIYDAFHAGFVHKAQGPPTGSRAPPTLT